MDKYAKNEMILAITANSKFTAQEINDILEIFSAVVQFSLQQGNTVELPGIGTLVPKENIVEFTAMDSLNEIVSDPNKTIQIQNVLGMTSTDLWKGATWVYKHNVNVC